MKSVDTSEPTNVTEPQAEPSTEAGPSSGPTTRSRFRILGPLEVEQSGRTITLGGAQQRTVLALLLVRANELVPADVLVTDLWDDHPPGNAKSTIYTYVSHLRKLLGADRIPRQAAGYRLLLETSELDASRFEKLLRDAAKMRHIDPGIAATILDEALGLWRGAALSDVAEQSTLLAEASRLDELRMVASEDRGDALLATGEQARVIGEARALLDRQPLRERLWQQLMLALYREGRQAEALNAFQQVREILADELGIDPSPELARLHERILRQDPALELRGEPLRGYRLLERIGEGPAGVVFRAIQPHVGRDVAVKIFHEHIAADPSFARLFEPEAQAVAALEHPHIAPVYDYWREPDRAHIVSRYLRGGSLAALVARGGRLDRERGLFVVDQLASALASAHRAGVAHGRVNASNVLFDGERNAYLADFRVAIGPPPDPADDIRDLALLARDVLDDPIPPDVEELIDRAVLRTDVPEAGAFVLALHGAAQPGGPMPPLLTVDLRNPYKGLRAFTESDAPDFFGRNELVARLIARLGGGDRGSRFLAVVGPSGGGKSSVVRAGVVPEIRCGALGDPQTSFVAEMFPGVHPIEELEAALLRIATRPASRVHDLLDQGPRGLLDATDLVLPPPAQLTLVIDQLEELFTLTGDEHERELFMESLRVATADPESRVRVIVTLRADFFDRPLVYPRFGELLATTTEAVPPLTPDELEQAIRRPAEGVGVTPEPGLAAEIVADVSGQPGALPLLQYALTELFERREDERLTLAAFRAIGGVGGALGARADRICDGIDDDGRRAARQIFLRLVHLGEGRQDTRRRVAQSELDALEVDPRLVATVLDSYGRHRLLTFDREPATREPTIEIAHEALLSAWPRLRRWIDDAREDLRRERRLARAAGEWRGSHRDPSFLLRGARLEQAESWARATDLAIGRPERAYLKASVDHRDEELAVERARLDREARNERRSRSRLRALVVVLSVAALVAAGLTAVATRQGRRAETEARVAGARELAAAAVANIENDQQLSLLLAIEAAERTYAVDGTVLREAEEALHRAATASSLVASIPGSDPSDIFTEWPGAVDWGPQGLVVVDGIFESEGPRPDGIVDLRDEETGEIVRSLAGHDGSLTGAAFSPDGSTLATTGTDGFLKVWDLSSGEEIATVQGPGTARGPTFSEDGGRVAAGFGRFDATFGPEDVKRSEVQILDLVTDRVSILRAAPWLNDVALSPDGTRIVSVGGYSGRADLPVVDVRTGEVTWIDNDEGLLSVAWSPDGRFISAAGFSTVLVATPDGRTTFEFEGHSGGARWVDWAPDSTRLVTGGADGTAKIWEIGSQSATELQTLTARAGEITGIAFSPDGTRVLTRSEGRVMDVWDVGSAPGAEVASIVDAEELVSFTSGSLVTSRRDGSLTTLDLDTGDLSHRSIGWFEPPGGLYSSYDFSPDGGSVHVSHYVGPPPTVRDVETGAELFAGSDSGFDWSPDGAFSAFGGHLSIDVMDRAGRQVARFSSDDGFIIGEAGVHVGPEGLVALGGTDDEHDGYVKIWDWRSDEIVSEFAVSPGGEVMSFDASGSRIAAGSGDTTIWDVGTGRLLVTLPSGQEFPSDIAFSPDGSRVAEIDPDGTVRVYDASSGQEVLVLLGHDAGGHLMFSPDGSMLATVGGGIARIWALEIDDLLEIARDDVTRSLTDEECRQYLHVESCPVS